MTTRRVILGSIFIFVCAWVGLFILALQVEKPVSEDVPESAQEAVIIAQETQFTLEDVAKHNVAEDCWIVVRGIIYDVSTYIDNHPAQRRTITDYCGKETTIAFETKERGREHSAHAWKLLETYRIGLLKH